MYFEQISLSERAFFEVIVYFVSFSYLQLQVYHKNVRLENSQSRLSILALLPSYSLSLLILSRQSHNARAIFFDNRLTLNEYFSEVVSQLLKAKRHFSRSAIASSLSVSSYVS